MTMFAPNTRTTTATVKTSSPPTACPLTVITITRKIRKDWVTPADVLEAFPGVSIAIHYSRFNNREKNGKPARPKFHVLFPIDRMTDATLYSDMKKLVNSIFPYFDTKALDAARFFFGTQEPNVGALSWPHESHGIFK